VAPWHSAAEKLLDHMNDAQRDVALGLLAITFRGEDGAIGVMEYRVGGPQEGWLGFRFVAVEPRLRGLGLDSEAVRLTEDDALKQGLGRRPALPDEDSWRRHRPNAIIAMIRVPENAGPTTRDQEPV
jgi:predicted N-acetyltransferase YhbS